MKRAVSAGFTLIELLVVIGILSVLMVVLIPAVLEGRATADIAADRANLNWHASMWQIYQGKKGLPMPPGGGCKFVLAPWVNGVCQKTEENRDRFFTPGLERLDVRYGELLEIPVDEIWTSFEEITSADTQYAGLRAPFYRNLRDGNSAVISNDNEFGPAFEDGSINVLMANWATRNLQPAGQLKEYWDETDPNFYIEVGPNSNVPLLQPLGY